MNKNKERTCCHHQNQQQQETRRYVKQLEEQVQMHRDMLDLQNRDMERLSSRVEMVEEQWMFLDDLSNDSFLQRCEFKMQIHRLHFMVISIIVVFVIFSLCLVMLVARVIVIVLIAMTYYPIVFLLLMKINNVVIHIHMCVPLYILEHIHTLMKRMF